MWDKGFPRAVPPWWLVLWATAVRCN
jgi:hypothetical protein